MPRLAPLALLLLAWGVAAEPPTLAIENAGKPAEAFTGRGLEVRADVGFKRRDATGRWVWSRGLFPSAGGDGGGSRDVTSDVTVRVKYRAMWGDVREVRARAVSDPTLAPVTYAAVVPAKDLPGYGMMLRYWIEASAPGDASLAWTRKPRREGDFYGAVVDASAVRRETSLPTLHWFTEDEERAKWDYPVPSFVAFDARVERDDPSELRFYGKGVTARRRGSGRRGDPNMWGKSGTKDWPKRKFKLDFRGRDFAIRWGDDADGASSGDGRVDRVEELNLHSSYEEPGPESYLREALASATMRKLGVDASATKHVALRLNGRFYGLYVLVEQVDSAFLERRGRDPDGPLFKAVHWKYSNLRPRAPAWRPCAYAAEWEIPGWGKECPEVYRYSTGGLSKKDDPDARKKRELAARRSLDSLIDVLAEINSAAPGDTAATSKIWWRVDVPSVAREMAAQTVMLHQDRCAKNYYAYQDEKNSPGKWKTVPWDLEDAFGTDYRSRAGRCDDGGRKACRLDAGTYCVQSCEWWNSPFFCDRDHPQDVFTESGGRETWNHLVDAMLKDPGAKTAYFREIKRAMALLHGPDEWLANRAKELARRVEEDAKRDAAVWGRNAPSEGTDALLTQIRERRETLENEYGHLWAEL